MNRATSVDNPILSLVTSTEKRFCVRCDLRNEASPDAWSVDLGVFFQCVLLSPKLIISSLQSSLVRDQEERSPCLPVHELSRAPQDEADTPQMRVSFDDTR